MSDSNSMQAGPFAYTQNISSSRASSYVGAHADRQRRFEARSARRWGDWFVLDVPTPVLWLDDPYVSAFDDGCEIPEPIVIDLWP